jgi:hypothetical protein
LVKAVNPELSAAELVAILKATTDKIIDENPDPILGHQKGTYNTQGYSEWFGYGRVNAGKAVRRASPDVSEPPAAPETAEAPAAIQIIAALVNPRGPETGAEKLMLINLSDQPVDLGGWTITDQRGNTDQLATYSLRAGSVVRIGLRQVRLLNAGGVIAINNGSGALVHKVNYERSDTKQEGWWVLF